MRATSAAVSKDGVPPPKKIESAGHRLAARLYLQAHGVHVARLERFVEQPPVEVAVVADRAAEGDVNVDAEH